MCVGDRDLDFERRGECETLAPPWPELRTTSLVEWLLAPGAKLSLKLRGWLPDDCLSGDEFCGIKVGGCVVASRRSRLETTA